eukprot:4435568-Pleurochrysis_carterae.AAC.3
MFGSRCLKRFRRSRPFCSFVSSGADRRGGDCGVRSRQLVEPSLRGRLAHALDPTRHWLQDRAATMPPQLVGSSLVDQLLRLARAAFHNGGGLLLLPADAQALSKARLARALSRPPVARTASAGLASVLRPGAFLRR